MITSVVSSRLIVRDAKRMVKNQEEIVHMFIPCLLPSPPNHGNGGHRSRLRRRHRHRQAGIRLKIDSIPTLSSQFRINLIKSDLRSRPRCKYYRRRCKIRAPCCDEIRMRLQISMEKQKDRHEIPHREIAQVICLLCDTEQPVAQVCMNCRVMMGRTQRNRREKRKRLKEEDKEHTLLKHKFYLSIGSNMDYYFNVIAIHRNMHDTATARARYGAFKLYLEAMSEK